MKFLPRVCDSSLFSRLPGTQFPVSMVHRDNIVLLRDVFHIGLVIGPMPDVLA